MNGNSQLLDERTSIEKQLDMLHRDGYFDAENIIRELLRMIRISDLCQNNTESTKLVRDLRGYAKLYRSGETLNRKIDKTEEVMEEAADVIEHLLKKLSTKKLSTKKLSTKKRELEYMKDFSREACFESEECRDQLRSLWTAYCLHNNLIVDTGTYDDDILELWSAVSLGEEDTAEWSDFDSFDDFMCAHLV